MTIELYHKLAKHLDSLPGGLPATASGVELRILRRLFTPEEAELALHLTLLAEEPRVVARRARRPVDEVARCLADMEQKGLVYALHSRGRPPRYMAAQFAVGFYEYQVNKLTPELIPDVEEYLPQWWDSKTWRQAPQLRTIPVGESIDPQLEVLPYEQAETLIRGRRRCAVAPCICRQERRLAGEGCDKPLEGCLTFDQAADYYVRNGMARAVSHDEALAVLRQAEAAGLVLQPGNARQALSICTCCACCCGILRMLKREASPARIVSTPFHASLEADRCLGCSTCLERCPMEALSLEGERAILDAERCIGCGLCVTTCPSGALHLVRKPQAEQPHVPNDIVEATLKLGRARGKLGPAALIRLVVQSRIDRLLAQR